MSNDDFPDLVSLYLRLDVALDDLCVMEAASLLEESGLDVVSSSWEKTKLDSGAEGWLLMWVLPSLPDLKPLAASLKKKTGLAIAVSDFAWDAVPDVNWLEESYRSFPPLTIGPFFVHGSHYTEPPPKKGMIPLVIDAATAFGSGEHGTTSGCLEALVKLHKSGFVPKRILDMGSGSGILAIAAYKLWKKPVLAIDIDKEATRVACRHRTMNKVPSGPRGMSCATGDGYKAKQVRATKGGFDLIIANILAGPLVDMAPELSANLKTGGKAVLSGLLQTQEDAVLKAHAAEGLKRPSRFPRGEWQTLIINK